MDCKSVFVGDYARTAVGLPWFAVRVRSNCEHITVSALRDRGYEEFLPTYRRGGRFLNRMTDRALPLFPGYLFARFDPNSRLPILQIPAVLHILGIGQTPVPVDAAEIAAIQAMIASGLPIEPWPFLKVGERILIEQGPLAGLEGILVSARKNCRVVASVSLLQRSVAVEIDREWVRPLYRSPQYQLARAERPRMLRAVSSISPGLLAQ
jgi:transcription termination/antitermination protein NusG